MPPNLENLVPLIPLKVHTSQHLPDIDHLNQHYMQILFYSHIDWFGCLQLSLIFLLKLMVSLAH